MASLCTPATPHIFSVIAGMTTGLAKSYGIDVSIPPDDIHPDAVGDWTTTGTGVQHPQAQESSHAHVSNERPLSPAVAPINTPTGVVAKVPDTRRRPRYHSRSCHLYQRNKKDAHKARGGRNGVKKKKRRVHAASCKYYRK
jgi:hypothetical protein